MACEWKRSLLPLPIRCGLQGAPTQEQVAELSNLSAKYISQLERGISGGTLETILKLCNVYKVSPNTILKPFLNNKILNTNNDITEKYDKLSLKDKETINILIEHLLKQ